MWSHSLLCLKTIFLSQPPLAPPFGTERWCSYSQSHLQLWLAQQHISLNCWKESETVGSDLWCSENRLNKLPLSPNIGHLRTTRVVFGLFFFFLLSKGTFRLAPLKREKDFPLCHRIYTNNWELWRKRGRPVVGAVIAQHVSHSWLWILICVTLEPSGLITLRSCTFLKYICYPNCCLCRVISAASHGIHRSPMLSTTHSAFSPSTPPSSSSRAVLLCFKSFCVFSLQSELCTPESLRSAVWSYRYTATRHCISTSLFISSLGQGVSWGQMSFCFHEC